MSTSSNKVEEVGQTNAPHQESSQKFKELNSIYQALDKVQAIIEFDLEGNILFANQNFLSCLGYSLDEIKGKHHRIFCNEDYANSSDYKNFWANLKKGIFNTGEFKRISKSGGGCPRNFRSAGCYGSRSCRCDSRRNCV